MSDCDLQNQSDKPIGVFDSGLGGLTVVAELFKALPGEDIVYFGDSARVPYGIKSIETVRRFACEDAAFVQQLGAKMIVIACNTASAAAAETLATRSSEPVVDVIGPGAQAALKATEGPIGVIATEATVGSGAYERTIAATDPSREVVSVACPLLVPIIEEGRSENDPIVLSVLSEYLRELQRHRCGALILGCTHYPLLENAIGKLMGPDVELINSARAAAMEVQRQLSLAGKLSPRSSGGKLRCFTTDNSERFARLGERFGRRKIDEVEYVRIEELEASVSYHEF